MAKKIGNLWFGAVIGSFMLFFMGGFLSSADDVTVSSSEKVGADLLISGASAVNNYRETEVALQDNTFNTGVFAIPDDRFLETRGISQGNIISKDTPAGVKETVKDVSSKGNVPGVIQAFVVTLIVSIGIIVLVRLFRSDGSA